MGQSQSQHNDPLAVVMVPLPAQGHLNQLLHLSRLISARKVPVHFVGTATHNSQAKRRVQGWDPLSESNIKFRDFPLKFSSPPPDPNSVNKFPTQILPLLIAYTDLSGPFKDFIVELSATVEKIVVIYDSAIPYVVQDISSIPNAESYCFHSISAFSLYAFFWEAKGKPILPIGAEIVNEAPSSEGCFTPEYLKFQKQQQDVPNFKSGDIYNTSRVIEGSYVDLLAKEKWTGTDKNWAMGPFNPVSISEKNDSLNRHKSLDWLDNQIPNSVIFISFGSTSSLSDEQIKEIAFGLEKSQQNFIWGLRDADKGENSEKGDKFEGDVRKVELPEGFEERIRERGIIVRDWAPQLEILGHHSTGGFISHCGWNSCMESISMGVPIATWPMHSDQPKNAFLITKVLKIGVELKDWKRRDEVISSDAVEKAVQTLMCSAEGNEIRKRATKLRDDVKNALKEGGVTKKEMDSFIDHILKNRPEPRSDL